jgi:hypothetical protein
MKRRMQMLTGRVDMRKERRTPNQMSVNLNPIRHTSPPPQAAVVQPIDNPSRPRSLNIHWTHLLPLPYTTTPNPQHTIAASMSAFRTTTRLVSRRPAAIAQSLRFAPRWMSQDAQNKLLGADLEKADPTVYNIVQKVRGTAVRVEGTGTNTTVGETQTEALHQPHSFRELH